MRKRKKPQNQAFDELEDFEVEIDPEEPVYPLNVVCRLLDMQYWTVHELVEEGVLHPKRVGRRKKLFSYKDIKRLKYIKYLIEKKGVNIKGVKVIFEIRRDL